MGRINQKNILKTNLAGFELNNPVMTASGTFGYADEYSDFLDTQNLGAVVTKAITLFPREGNNHTRVFETPGGMINSIGLENVGIHKFFEEKYPILKEKNIEFVMNLAGSTQEEYVELARICQKQKIKAVEINISCPNVKSGCMEFGVKEDSLTNLIKAIRQEFHGCLIVKLTPNVTSIEKMGLAAQKAGADVLSAINTVKALGLKLEFNGREIKKNIIQGGMSGKAIKPIALGAVYRLYKTVDIPIIGMGGIYCLDDILEFFAVGAEAVQVGTANFTHPDVSECLINELVLFMEENGYLDILDLKKDLRRSINE